MSQSLSSRSRISHLAGSTPSPIYHFWSIVMNELTTNSYYTVMLCRWSARVTHLPFDVDRKMFVIISICYMNIIIITRILISWQFPILSSNFDKNWICSCESNLFLCSLQPVIYCLLEFLHFFHSFDLLSLHFAVVWNWNFSKKSEPNNENKMLKRKSSSSIHRTSTYEDSLVQQRKHSKMKLPLDFW